MKDYGIRRQKELLNSSLVLYFGNYESSNLRKKICAKLSPSFVLIVSVSRDDLSKSNIPFGDSYL